MDQLHQIPQAKKLLQDQAALRQALSSPEAQRVLAQLQKTDAAALRSAAQAAMDGNAAALQGIVRSLTGDPATAQAMEKLSKTLNK